MNFNFILILSKYKYFILLFLLFILLNLIIKYKLECIYIEIEKYIKFNLEGNLIHSPTEFYKRDIPEISIIITTYNGEVYLKPAVRSIQNQNFLNVEIIIVDDGSKDNTLKVANQLMNEDKRIKLLSNIINRGLFYTIIKGVLNAKGRYIMTLDQDDLYSTNCVFSLLYNEANKNSLDLLGFTGVYTGPQLKNIAKSNFLNNIGTVVILKPNIKNRFLGSNIKIQSATNLCLYLIKTQLFLYTIKLLGDSFINRNIDAGDDTILTFMFSRHAKTLKHLKKICYIIFKWPDKYSESLKFQRIIKQTEREIKSCYSYLTFIEVLFTFTENSDKYIAEKYFLLFFINQQKCRNNLGIKNDSIRICNLYLNNPYISQHTKKEISFYLNQTYQNI